MANYSRGGYNPVDLETEATRRPPGPARRSTARAVTSAPALSEPPRKDEKPALAIRGGVAGAAAGAGPDEGGPNDGILSVVFGGLAWMGFLLGWVLEGPFWWPTFLPSLAFAGLAVGFGLRGVGRTQARVGVEMARALAVTGLVLGIVHLGAVFLIPLLLLLFAVLFGCRTAPSCGSGSGRSEPPPESGCPCGQCCEDCATCCQDCCGSGSGGGPGGGGGCCDGCCGGCACAGCGDCGCGGCGDCGCGGCGDCGCGGCGDCGCGGCGGCGCAALASGPLVAARVGDLPIPLAMSRAFAHHPDAPEYREDVYHVRGARLCVGCFTTYPVFLLATAALLLLAPLAGAWWAWLAGGAAMASAQALSSAGLARRRWMKATVKTLLGAGLAALLHGVLASPLPDWGQVLLLLGTLGLASLSTIPRTRRMRKARRTAGCACQAPRTDRAAP